MINFPLSPNLLQKNASDHKKIQKLETLNLPLSVKRDLDNATLSSVLPEAIVITKVNAKMSKSEDIEKIVKT